jgi:beta-glucosidase
MGEMPCLARTVDCHSEPPLAGAKNLGVGLANFRLHGEILRFAQNDNLTQGHTVSFALAAAAVSSGPFAAMKGSGMTFPKNFVWGAATASYQIEGAAAEDGKGPSVWDMFCRKDGAIWEGQTGDVACDHYHRYKEDVRLAKRIGLNGYRLSISWPRVLPEGVGAVNSKGLDFYDRLVDALLAAGITPYVTLFHWDFPYELYCRGGWLNRASADWFAEYASVVVSRLGDRVRHWITMNETQCFVGLGHHDGAHAPGDKLGWSETLRVGHNAMRAHGKAVRAIRAASPGPCQVSYAPMSCTNYPATENPRDVAAARRAHFSVTARHQWNNTWWMDPVYLGRYPEDGLKLFGKNAPRIHPGDMETISPPLDFFCHNTYFGAPTRAGQDGKPEVVPMPMGHPLTAFRWFVSPEAIYWSTKFAYERYKLPMVVTENGMSGIDWIALDGKCHDPQRIDYTARYLMQLERAIRDGVDVRGYFHWTLLDNFEWSFGVRERFGLIHTDFVTQQRTLKDSALWYKKVIASNGRSLKKK